MDWYYANERDEQVQVSEDELKRLAQTGALKPDAFVWNESMDDWKACRLVKPEWFTNVATAPSVGTAPATGSGILPAPTSSAPGDPTPVLPRRQAVQPTDGLALASLICGIAGLVFMGCYGAGFPISLAGVICGHMCRKRLLSEGNTSSAGLALAGIITGYIGLALIVLALLIIGLFFGFAIFASEMAPATSTP